MIEVDHTGPIVGLYDVHLEKPEAEQRVQFVESVAQWVRDAVGDGALIVLGGDALNNEDAKKWENSTQHAHCVREAIREANCHSLFIRGNHDMEIPENEIEDLLGCDAVAEVCIVQRKQSRLLLMHGDPLLPPEEWNGDDTPPEVTRGRGELWQIFQQLYAEREEDRKRYEKPDRRFFESTLSLRFQRVRRRFLAEYASHYGANAVLSGHTHNPCIAHLTTLSGSDVVVADGSVLRRFDGQPTMQIVREDIVGLLEQSSINGFSERKKSHIPCVI